MNSLQHEFSKSRYFAGLNQGQKKFFNAFFKGDNIFLTGAAGTGKSYCIKVLFEFMDEHGIFIAKTALTGVAALNIGGVTIHSWAGMGLAEEDLPGVISKARNNRRAIDRIRNTSVLFIDEVSMSSADLMNKIDGVLKSIRFNKKPFGGMQVIFSGDFLQLPPISKGYGSKEFAFDAPAWKNGEIKMVNLTKLVRQDETSAFAKLLQSIRFGKTDGIDLLVSRVGATLMGTTDPIRVFCKNIDINRYNDSKYQSIAAPEQAFYCKDTGSDRYVTVFDKNCPAPPILKLKPGSQVMLLANLDVKEGLVNGSIGRVTGFSTCGPIVEFENGACSVVDNYKWEAKEQELDLSGKMRYKVVATRSQIPLKLAWAASVHKTQGQTLDRAIIDVSAAFEYGQIYVALSRVKSLEGLSLVDFSPSAIKAHPHCINFYQEKTKTQ